MLALAFSANAMAIDSKPATQSTIEANNNVLKSLPFSDKKDFEDVQRGLVATENTVRQRV